MCGGGGMMGNMLRRGESSWLCMKFEFGSIAGHGSLIRVLPLLFLAVVLPFLASPLCDSMLCAAHFLYEIS